MNTPQTINLDRGTHGDEGHFVTIHGRAVFIVDDHDGAKGGGKFTRKAVESRLLKHHEERGGSAMRESRGQFTQDAGHDLVGKSHLTFHKKLPGEVRKYIEGNPSAKRLIRITSDRTAAKGADAFAAMGDKYFDMLDEASGDRIKDAKAVAHKSDDPAIRFDAALHDTMKAGGERKRMSLVPSHELEEGHEFTINGIAVKVVEDGGERVLESKGFPRVPVDAFEHIPHDRGSLKHPTPGHTSHVGAGETIPFSRMIELSQMSLFGDNSNAGSQGHLFAKQKHGEHEGHWVTIHGRHIFIRDGESVSKAMEREGMGEKKPTARDTIDKMKGAEKPTPETNDLGKGEMRDVKSASMTIEDHRASLGLPRRGLDIDHSILSPNGRVSQRTRNATNAALGDKFNRIAQADKDYESKVKSGEITDPSGEYSQEKYRAESERSQRTSDESRYSFLKSFAAHGFDGIGQKRKVREEFTQLHEKLFPGTPAPIGQAPKREKKKSIWDSILKQQRESTSTLSGAVYLSAGTLDKAKPDNIPDDAPTHVNGQRVHYRWTDAALSGRWVHPVTKTRIDIDDGRLSRWADRINLALSRGVNLPIVRDHKESSANTLGYIYGAKSGDGRLKLLNGYIGQDSLREARKNFLSVGIDPDFRDSHGNSYGEAIRHVATTPIPVIHGQKGFIAASREDATQTEVDYLVPLKETDMKLTDDERNAIVSTLGIEAVDDESAVELLTATITDLQTEVSEANRKATELSAAKDAADAKITALSAAAPVIVEHKPDARDVENARMRIELSATKGDIPAWLAKALTAKLDSAPVLLSREADDKPTFLADLLAIFDGQKLGTKTEEKTGIQTLSREVPDGETKAATLDDNPLIKLARQMNERK